MDNWKYKSLEWIHKVREEDHEKTPQGHVIHDYAKGLSPKELIGKTRKSAEDTAKALKLEIIHPKG